MVRVFISHVEVDRTIAQALASSLECVGFETWYYERDSIPGVSYLLQTKAAIEESAALVVLISSSSVQSHQVTKEIVRAHEAEKPILPVLVDMTHSEFQQRQPEWREAIGAASSVSLADRSVEDVGRAIAKGLTILVGETPVEPRRSTLVLRKRPLDRGTEGSGPPEVAIPRFSIPLTEKEAEWRTLEGQVLAGKYFLRGAIGYGGSGAVFRAEGVLTGRPLALKLFYALERSRFNQVRQTTDRSVRGLVAIEHPNIPTVFDYGLLAQPEDCASLYIATELIEGVPLQEWSASPGKARTDAECPGTSDPASGADRLCSVKFEIARQIASAMHAAHMVEFINPSGFLERGVLHGDLTPDNVLIRSNGSPAIIDFMFPDFQRLLVAPYWGDDHFLDRRWKEVDGRFGFSVPQTGAFGTPGFMPPEQAVRGFVTPASDVYTLGLTFAHLFFQDIYVQCHDVPPFLQAWHSGWRRVHEGAAAGVPDSVARRYAAAEALIARMTEPQPEDRIQTMAEVMEELAKG